MGYAERNSQSILHNRPHSQILEENWLIANGVSGSDAVSDLNVIC